MKRTNNKGTATPALKPVPGVWYWWCYCPRCKAWCATEVDESNGLVSLSHHAGSRIVQCICGDVIRSSLDRLKQAKATAAGQPE